MRRPLRSVLGAVALSLVLVGTAGAGGAPDPSPPTVAGPTTPAGSDGTSGEGETPTDGPGITLVEQTHWVEPDGDLALRLRVDGAPDGAALEVALHERLTGRIQFTESLDGTGLGPVLDRRCGALAASGIVALDPCRLDLADASLDEDGAVTIALSVRSGPGPADRILLPGDGVYPVSITLTDAGGATLDTVVTHLRRLPDAGDDSPPLAVTTLLPLTAAVAHQPDATIAIDPRRRAALRALAQVLADHPDVPLVVLPTPETVDALGLTEDPAVATLSGALDGRQVLALPYVDVDVGSWWAAGMDPELEDLLTTGGDRLSTWLDVRPDRRTWLVQPTTDAATTARLRAFGVDQLVVPEEQLAPLDQDRYPLALDQPFAVPAEDGTTVPAVMDDQELRSHIGSTGDPVLDAHVVLADLALLYAQRPGVSRGVAFSLPADDLDPRFLDTLLAGLEEPSVLAASTADELFATAEAAQAADTAEPLVRPVLAVPPPGLGNYPEQRRQADAELVPYRALVGDAPELDEMTDLLRVSGDRSLTEEEQQAYLDAPTRLLRSTVDAIVAPDQPAVTLTAREGTIPINLVNTSERDIAVSVHLESEKLEFPDGSVVETVLTPGENRLAVAVEARATGAFPVEVRVTSPDGSIELATTRFSLRSTAVPGIGIALSALAALVLAVWWARHWRTARRARRLVPTATSPELHDQVLEDITRV